MDIITLKNILRQGEGETIEFKTSFSKESIETLVAFASTKGGKLFIGVNNNGSIIGTQTGEETVQKWINQIKQNSPPSIIPDVEVINIIKKYTRMQPEFVSTNSKKDQT